MLYCVLQCYCFLLFHDLCPDPCVHCMCVAGYCFLLFQDEMSVQALIEACLVEDSKLYWCVSSPTMKDKPVSDVATTTPHTCCHGHNLLLDFTQVDYYK